MRMVRGVVSSKLNIEQGIWDTEFQTNARAKGVQVQSGGVLMHSLFEHRITNREHRMNEGRSPRFGSRLKF